MQPMAPAAAAHVRRANHSPLCSSRRNTRRGFRVHEEKFSIHANAVVALKRHHEASARPRRRLDIRCAHRLAARRPRTDAHARCLIADAQPRHRKKPADMVPWSILTMVTCALCKLLALSPSLCISTSLFFSSSAEIPGSCRILRGSISCGLRVHSKQLVLMVCVPRGVQAPLKYTNENGL